MTAREHDELLAALDKLATLVRVTRVESIIDGMGEAQLEELLEQIRSKMTK